MKNKGFTLVELSIALVIIGLLIGGLLVGQSLIHSAKVQTVVKIVSQYEIAVTNFQVRYKQFPGDSDKFYPAGNVNSLIDEGDQVYGGDCGDGYGSEEYKNAFAHLSQARMVTDSFVPMCESPVSHFFADTANAGVVHPALPAGEIYADYMWGNNSWMHYYMDPAPVFALYVGKSFVLPLENKLGLVTPEIGRIKGGLYNVATYQNGAALDDPDYKCWESDWSTPSNCNTSSPGFGHLGFFLRPI